MVYLVETIIFWYFRTWRIIDWIVSKNMNVTIALELHVFDDNSTVGLVESWFISTDIFMIICSVLIIILSIIFLFIIIFDKTCHTVPMLLIANTCLAALIIGCTVLSAGGFILQNDLKQKDYQDPLCVTRAYLIYTACGIFNFSFTLQSLYRYMIAVYPSRLFFQSFRCQTLFICLTWILCIIFPYECIPTHEIAYVVETHMCQAKLHPSVCIIYGIFCNCNLPISMIIFIYWKLFRYVKQMGMNAAASNSLARAKRELKAVHRIVVLIITLIVITFPYMISVIMSFIKPSMKPYTRIAYAFFQLSNLSAMIYLFFITTPLKEFVMKIWHLKSNVMTP